MAEPVLPVDFTHLADNLRILRLAQRKTQRALAAEAGLSQSYLCLLERHRWPSDVEHVDRLAKALCVEPGRLLGRFARHVRRPHIVDNALRRAGGAADKGGQR